MRKLAAERGQTLNRVIVDLLTQSVLKQCDLSDIVGKWEDDPAFDEIIASQRKIDWAKWK